MLATGTFPQNKSRKCIFCQFRASNTINQFSYFFIVFFFSQVCGTDGLTYASACELQNQAAVRVDYPGECISNTSSLEELCQRVLNDDRCVSNDMNCDSLVFPEDGCCPICGMLVKDLLQFSSHQLPEYFFTSLIQNLHAHYFFDQVVYLRNFKTGFFNS